MGQFRTHAPQQNGFLYHLWFTRGNEDRWRKHPLAKCNGGRIANPDWQGPHVKPDVAILQAKLLGAAPARPR